MSFMSSFDKTNFHVSKSSCHFLKGEFTSADYQQWLK